MSTISEEKSPKKKDSNLGEFPSLGNAPAAMGQTSMFMPKVAQDSEQASSYQPQNNGHPTIHADIADNTSDAEIVPLPMKRKKKKKKVQQQPEF